MTTLTERISNGREVDRLLRDIERLAESVGCTFWGDPILIEDYRRAIAAKEQRT